MPTNIDKKSQPKTKSAAKSRKEWILITGISGNIGRRLAKQLHKNESIIGIDPRPFHDKPKDVLHFEMELWQKRAETIFRQHKLKAVYHIPIMHNPREKTRQHHSENIMGITRLLDYCKRYQTPKVIIASSALAYGANPDNDAYLTEESPLKGGRRSLETRDLIEMDMLAQSYFWKAPNLQVVILRPVHIVGEDIKNPPSNYLRLDPAPVVAGFDPMVQLIHIEDFIYAMEKCLHSKARGIFNIVGQGAAPLRALLKTAGKKTIDIPSPLLNRLVALGWKWRFTQFSAEDVSFIYYGGMVDGSRAEQELGFRARLSVRETVYRTIAGQPD